MLGKNKTDYLDYIINFFKKNNLKLKLYQFTFELKQLPTENKIMHYTDIKIEINRNGDFLFTVINENGWGIFLQFLYNEFNPNLYNPGKQLMREEIDQFGYESGTIKKFSKIIINDAVFWELSYELINEVIKNKHFTLTLSINMGEQHQNFNGYFMVQCINSEFLKLAKLPQIEESLCFCENFSSRPKRQKFPNFRIEFTTRGRHDLIIYNEMGLSEALYILYDEFCYADAVKPTEEYCEKYAFNEETFSSQKRYSGVYINNIYYSEYGENMIVNLIKYRCCYLLPYQPNLRFTYNVDRCFDHDTHLVKMYENEDYFKDFESMFEYPIMD